MKIKLIFDDWRNSRGIRTDNSILNSGIFHSGTTFNGEIMLTPEDEAELKRHMEHGFRPVFWVMSI